MLTDRQKLVCLPLVPLVVLCLFVVVIMALHCDCYASLWSFQSHSSHVQFLFVAVAVVLHLILHPLEKRVFVVFSFFLVAVFCLSLWLFAIISCIFMITFALLCCHFLFILCVFLVDLHLFLVTWCHVVGIS